MNYEILFKEFSGNLGFILWRRMGNKLLLVATSFTFLILLSGLLIFGILGEVITYFSNPLTYVLHIFIFSFFLSAGWFVRNYPKVIWSTKHMLLVSEDKYLQIVQKWSKKWNNNALYISTGLFWGLLSIIHGILGFQNTQMASPFSIWLSSSHCLYFKFYFCFLLFIAGFILGLGIFGFILFIFQISDLFNCKLDLSKQLCFKGLGDFFIKLVFWGSLFLSFGVVYFYHYHGILEILVLVFGTVLLGSSFFLPQITYNKSCKRAQIDILVELSDNFGLLYRNYNISINRNEHSNSLHTDIIATIALLNYFKEIPTWLWSSKLALQLFIALIIPTATLFINRFIVAFLGFS